MHNYSDYIRPIQYSETPARWRGLCAPLEVRGSAEIRTWSQSIYSVDTLGPNSESPHKGSSNTPTKCSDSSTGDRNHAGGSTAQPGETSQIDKSTRILTKITQYRPALYLHEVWRGFVCGSGRKRKTRFSLKTLPSGTSI
jgi:hypothetical protein